MNIDLQDNSTQASLNGVDKFNTYNNHIIGIKLIYPQNWTVVEYLYNPVSNNTIVGFYSNSKTSSQLGNIAGVSGNFVPYLDVYEFNSKNISLNKLFNITKSKFMNNISFAINESKLIPFKDNQQGFELIYDVIGGNDAFLKKIQVYTIIQDKVFTISFTSQRDTFEDYLPIAHKMINSFESTKKPI